MHRLKPPAGAGSQFALPFGAGVVVLDEDLQRAVGFGAQRIAVAQRVASDRVRHQEVLVGVHRERPERLHGRQLAGREAEHGIDARPTAAGPRRRRRSPGRRRPRRGSRPAPSARRSRAARSWCRSVRDRGCMPPAVHRLSERLHRRAVKPRARRPRRRPRRRRRSTRAGGRDRTSRRARSPAAPSRSDDRLVVLGRADSPSSSCASAREERPGAQLLDLRDGRARCRARGAGRAARRRRPSPRGLASPTRCSGTSWYWRWIAWTAS